MAPAHPSIRRHPRARRVASAIGALVLAALAAAPRAGAQEDWRSGVAEVPVRYDIKAQMRTGQGEEQRVRITGTQRVTWRNDSADEVSSLYFHLYPNAFLNTRSTFLREGRDSGLELPEDVQFGRIDVQGIDLVAGTEPLTLEYVQPDDGNPDDRTVARVALDEPVQPGRSLSVNLRFTTTLPTVIKRMGHRNDFVMAAQWYPKLGRYVGTSVKSPNVHEGWYCHQYHRNSEFHADFADYDVELKVPDDVLVGATGERVETSRDERILLRTETWQARSVVDFAWTADRRFLRGRDDRAEPLGLVQQVHPLRAPAGVAPGDDPVQKERDRIASLLGIEPDALTLPPVEVTLLLQPEHERQAERHFEAARVALGLFGLWFGPYPYEHLTIVDPAHGARAAGGMEYPQLVTAGTREVAPKDALQPEGVVVHEIGHQWFMNVLASNEAEEAWLDEGLTTYFTAHALDIAYGPAVDMHRRLGIPFLVTPFMDFAGLGSGWPEWVGLPGWMHPPELEILTLWRDLPPLTALPTTKYRDDPIEPRRRAYLSRAGWDPLVLPSWQYKDRASYGVNAYSRPALFLATLRRTLHARLGADEGERAFLLGMRRYAREWRFRHPTTSDFLTAFGAGSGFDVGPLAAALLSGSGVLDYAIESIETKRPPELQGWVDGPDGPVEVDPVDESPSARPERTFVVVRRRGEVVVPVRLQTTRDDGPPDQVAWQTHEWDGKDRYKVFELDGTVVAARLHPDAEYLQDVDRRNDSRKTRLDGRPGVKWGVRFLLWLENAALSYGRFL